MLNYIKLATVTKLYIELQRTEHVVLVTWQ